MVCYLSIGKGLAKRMPFDSLVYQRVRLRAARYG